jgi:hypothetical protein
MTSEACEETYTFLGVRQDGAIPVMDIVSHRGDADALTHAHNWLAGHTSCVRAQVWRGGVLVGEVSPAAPVA